MSGLLPRTEPSSGTGNFNSISTQTLVVSGTGFISNLVTTGFSPTSVTTATINGAPSLTIATGSPLANALIVPGTGIANDNTTTRVLGLSPGDNETLVYKTNVADTSTAQTFTNKTLDSAANTITITSGTLAATNINSVLNQAVTTTATPTFGLTTITYSSVNLCGLQVNNTNGAGTAGGMMCLNNGLPVFEIGANNSTNEAYLFNHQNTAMKFGTNFVERMRIDGPGITNDNTITNILGLGGGGGISLRTKTNVADTSTAQTFTNKTLDSAANTITITSAPLAAANINTVLNQAVTTTSTPTFGATTISYNTNAGGLIIDNTNTGVNTSGVVCRVNGTSTLNLGVNASTSEGYLYTLVADDLKFGTSTTERLRIGAASNAITTSNINSVTQNLGTNNTFALGTKGNYAYSTSGGAIFSGAGIGDINLQNTDATKGINVGVGNTTPQLNINSTTATWALNTVRQTIGTNNTFALGTKSDYGYSSGAGTFFSSAAIGDINIRNTDTTKSLNLGVGSGTAQVSIGNALITTNVTLKPNVAADETALNWAAINASGNLVTRAISSGRFTTTWTVTTGFGTPSTLQINYFRVGNVVSCTAVFSGTSVAVGVNTATITLPITPATFATGSDCTGVVVAVPTALAVDIQGLVGALSLGTTATVQVRNTSVGSVTVDLYCSFSYQLS